MTYEDHGWLTRQGFVNIATGEFFFTNSDRMRFQSADVQRKKAAAVLAELDTILVEAKDDIDQRMMEFRAYGKFYDSIVVGTTLVSLEVAQQNFPNLGKE